MSSTTTESAPVTADKPVRRVVSKRAPKAAAAPVAADPEPVVAAVATTEAPKKRKAAPKKEKKATAEEATVAPPAADATSADAPKEKEKRNRTPRVHREFIVAFGDLNVDEKLRSFTKEAFEEWKTLTKAAVEQIRFKEWERNKREFYRAIKNLQKKKKRTAKGYNWEATAENHLQRLKSMPREEFKDLDGAWLSNYQFSGKYDASTLDKEGCPEKGAIPTYTVYIAALHHGYKPLGIVSENGTRTGDTITFITPVEGRREYVGVALPFQNKERSPFSVILKDRVHKSVTPTA